MYPFFFTFTNSGDPDEMQHYAEFHLGLHCKSVCKSIRLGDSRKINCGHASHHASLVNVADQKFKIVQIIEYC